MTAYKESQQLISTDAVLDFQSTASDIALSCNELALAQKVIMAQQKQIATLNGKVRRLHHVAEGRY